MKTIFTLALALFLSMSVLAQVKVYFVKNDSVMTFKKVKPLHGALKCYFIDKKMGTRTFATEEIKYVYMKEKYFGVSKKGLIKIKNDLCQDEATKNGAADACKNYKKYSPAGTGTFLTTFFTGAVLGLIPALSTSLTAPKTKNLGIPADKQTESENYLFGYKTQAKRIKSGRVWGNYGSGIVYAILTTVVINSISKMGSAAK
jgi:hypothetical protein